MDLACRHSPWRSATTSLKRLLSTNRKIKEHDVLLLRQQGPKYPKWHFTSPLRSSDSVKLSYGASIAASDLIGKHLLDVVLDSKGNRVVLQEPSLSSYVVNSERHATPIYPHDANTIVSLLDLNLPRPGEEDEEEECAADDEAAVKRPFEIFEAGTGMGSLTIHIARAIHAANPAVPPSLRRALCEAGFQPRSDSSLMRVQLEPSAEERLRQYQASRRAVLHSLDQKAKHTHAAYKLVRRFHRALYLPTIDFHVAGIDDYLGARLEQSGRKPFLSRAILDLPSAHDHAERVIQALLPNGILVLFKPSISQIGEFLKWSTQTRQPVRLEKVLELPLSTTLDGVHDAGGGRHWDVRTVVPKSSQGGDCKIVQVMRPKVGDRVAGGGFVAVLRRWPDDQGGSEQETRDSADKEDAEHTDE